jgi:hypothetical protein
MEFSGCVYEAGTSRPAKSRGEIKQYIRNSQIYCQSNFTLKLLWRRGERLAAHCQGVGEIYFRR